jgi:hypothetical protein
MNTGDKFTMDSYQDTDKVFDDNVGIYDADTATMALRSQFKLDLTALKGYAEKMDQPTAWLTREKSDARQVLLTNLHPFSVDLVRFANSKPDEKILDKVKMTKGNMWHLNENNLLIYTHTCIEIARANLAGLVNFSITEEGIMALEADLTVFETKRYQRRLLLDDKKKAQAVFVLTKRKINHLLKDELDWSIESYREAQPDFVNHYFTARQVVKGIHHPYDILGYLTDEATGNPISLGSVLVEGINLSVDITENGTFRFKSFPEGEHRLVIENINYKTLYVTIRRYASERSKLHLKMVAVPIEETQPVL